MKVLIWILCVFANGVLIALLRQGGIFLGAIPAFILYGLTFWLARTLCKKWDERKGVDDVPKPPVRQISICANCGYKAFGFDQCPQCGKTQKVYEYADVAEEPPKVEEGDKICFCRKCGEKLIDNSQFCRKCGTEIVKE